MRVLPILLLVIACPALARAQATSASTVPSVEGAPVAPPAPPEAFQQTPPGVVPAAPPIAAPPPSGYGYGYVPHVTDLARAKTLSELQMLDLRIASVRRQQREHGLIGPAAMTGAGYGLAAAFGIVAVLEWALSEDIRQGNCGYRRLHDDYDYSNRCDVNNDGIVDHDDRRITRTLARTFGGLSVAGAGLGIAGTVLLVKRLTKRRAYNPELRDLGVKRGQLLQQLRYGGSYSQNGGLQLTVGGRF